MPEVISKYPEVTIQVLQEAGARCGEGLPQRILTKCPKERFCSLPTGEICVYGVDEVGQATQFTSQDFIAISQTMPVRQPGTNVAILTVLLLVVIAFILGALLASRLKSWKQSLRKSGN